MRDRTDSTAEHADRKLRVVKRAVEAFLKKHYPAELAIFPTVWRQFLEARSKGLALHELGHGANTKTPTWALSFAAMRRVELVAPVVILTLYACLDELDNPSTILEPSVEKFQAAIRSCAQIFDAPPDVSERMAATLPNRLLTLFAREQIPVTHQTIIAPETHISISPNGQIEVNGLQITLTPQAAMVLCELVRSTRVHWLDAFVLFDDWTRHPPRNPYGAFRTIVSRINTPCSQMRLSVEAEKGIGKGNTGYWRLSLPTGCTLGGAISEAQAHVVRAQMLAQEQQYSDALGLALRAIEIDPLNVQAACIVLESRTALADVNPSPMLMRACLRTLLLRERLLERAHKTISTLDNITEEDTRDYLDFLLAQLRSVRRARIAADAYLADKGVLSEEEIIVRELGDYVHRLHDQEERGAVLEVLAEHPQIRGVLRNAAKRCRKLMGTWDIRVSAQDIEGKIWTLFAEGTCAKDAAQYKNLSHLKACWVTYLARTACLELLAESTKLLDMKPGRSSDSVEKLEDPEWDFRDKITDEAQDSLDS